MAPTNKQATKEEVAGMTLLQIEELTANAAGDKGFSMAAIADTQILELPFKLALVLISNMATLEAHRKGLNSDVSGNMADEMQGLFEAYRTKVGPIALSPEKKYLVAKLMLIASEVAEALEAVLGITEDAPKTSQPMWVEEVADVIIRAIGITLDGETAFPGERLCISEAVVEKILFNRSRPPKHGNKLY